MNTKRFNVLIEINERENDGIPPTKVLMSKSTMLEFVAGAEEDGNIRTARPRWYLRFWGFVRRKPEPPLVAVLIYGLNVEIDDTMRHGIVILQHED